MSLIGKYKTVISNFTYLSILNVLNIVLPLVVIPYITNIVGASYFGDYIYVLVLVQNINIITSYGYLFSATKKISQNRDDKLTVNKIFNAVIGGRLLIAVSTVLLVFVFSSLLLESKARLFMFVTSLGMVFGDVFIPTWLFQGLERMKYMTIVNSISKILFTLLVFVIITEKEDYKIILLLNSIGYLLAAVLSMILVKTQFAISINIPTWNEIKTELREGFALFFSTLGMSLYRNINVLILNFFVTSSSVAVYALAEKVIKACQAIVSPISQAMFPYFGYRFKNEDKKNNIKSLFKISSLLLTILTIMSVLIYLFSNPLARLFGEDFTNVKPLLNIMLPVFIFGSLNYLLGFVGLVNMNYQRHFFYAVMSSGTIAIALLLIFVNTIGVKAASIAMSMSEIILSSICIIKLIKTYKRCQRSYQN